MKQFLTAVLLVMTTILPAQVADSLLYKSLDPYYFHLNYLKEEKVLLIDVREFFEFKRSRLKDAVSIPSSGKLDISADTIPKDVALFLYCTTDYRSKRVARFFSEKGFSKVYSLDGGIVEWRKEGYPVDKKRVRRR